MTTNLCSTIKVVDLLNPLDLENVSTRYEPWEAGKPLSAYIPKDCDYVVSVSGGVVEAEMWDTICPQQDDVIVMVPLLEGGGGGGGGKMILRLVAIVALMVFTMGTAAWALPALLANAGIVAGSTAAMVITAGVNIAGTMLINALIPAQPASSGTMDSSPNYGIAAPSNTSREGTVVPVVYGRHRIAGNYIQMQTENTRDTQLFYALINAGEGPIVGISDMKINDQPLENWSDVDVELRLGTEDQAVIPWFADTLTAMGVSTKLPSDEALGSNQEWLTRITDKVIDKLRIDLMAPQGVAWITDKGKVKPNTVPVHVRYIRCNADGTDIQGEQWQTAIRVGSGIETIPGYTYYPPLPPGYGSGSGSGPNIDPDTGVEVAPKAKTVFPGVNAVSGEYIPHDGPFDPNPSTPNNALKTIESSTLRAGHEVHQGMIRDVQTKTFIGTVVNRIIDTVDQTTTNSAGPWATLEIREKTTQLFRRSYVTPEIPQGYYKVQVRRGSFEEPREGKAHDVLHWESLVQINTQDVAYRNTALVGMRIRFEDQLNGVPSISYVHHGVLVRQIDPATGEWVMGSSENPAWACLDLLTNPRYGGRVPLSQVDIAAFVTWANYCLAKKIEFNMVFDQNLSIWDAMKYVCRVGRAQVIRTGTKFSVVLEASDIPVMMFSEQNITKGSFAINYLPLADRANSVEVTFWDAAQDYERTTLKVVDPSIIEGANERVAKITLHGVTDRQQAMNEGVLQINLNKYITRTVQLEASLDALACTVGSLVLVKHVATDFQYSGRVEQASAGQLQLDRPVYFTNGFTHKVLIHDPLLQTRAGGVVQSINLSTNSITVSGWVDTPAPPGMPHWRRSTTLKVTGGGSTHEFAVVAIQDSGQWFEIYVEPGHMSSVTYALVNRQADLYLQDAIIEMSATSAGGSETDVIDVTPPSGFNAAGISPLAHFMFGAESFLKRPYRLMAVEPGSEPTTRKLTMLEYDAAVYAASEILPNPGYEVLPNPMADEIGHVRNMTTVTRVLYEGSGKAEFWLDLAWEAPQRGTYAGAKIYMRPDTSDSFELAGEITGDQMYYSVKAPLNEGTYFVRVVSKDPMGASPPASSAPTYTWVLSNSLEPIPLVSFIAEAKGGFNALRWEILKAFKLDRVEIAYYFVPDPPAGGWPVGQEPDESVLALAVPFTPEDELAVGPNPSNPPVCSILPAGQVNSVEHTGVGTGRYRYWISLFDKAMPDLRSAWTLAVPGVLTSFSTVQELIDLEGIQAEIMLNYRAELNAVQADLQNDLALTNSAVTALDTRLDAEELLSADLNAAIIAESNARQTEDTALANSLNGAVTRLGAAEAAIGNEIQARIDGDSALASDLTLLQTDLTTIAGRRGRVYAQPAPPATAEQDELWIDTDDNNRLYRWDNGAWVPADDLRIGLNAQAVNSLTTRVTDTEAGLASQGNQIVVLQNSIDTTTANLGVTSQAVTDLSSRVTVAEGNIASTSGDVVQLQNEISNRNRVYVQDDEPLGTQHTQNDLWIDSNDGNKLYRWNGMDWVDVADGRFGARNRVYVQPAAPAEPPFVVNDLWIDTDDNNRLYRWDGAGWVDAGDGRVSANATAINLLTNRVAANEGNISSISSSITSLSNEIDATNTIYAQAEPPTVDLNINDLWIDIDDANRMRSWNGTQWVNVAASPTGSQNAVYAQPAPPSGVIAPGALWIDTDDGNRVYRWDGSSWLDTADTRIVGNATAISGLQSRVTSVEGTVNSQSSQLTQLENSLGAKNRTWVQPEPPPGTSHTRGDLWIDTDDGNKLYMWDANWALAEDGRFSQMARVFAQTTPPPAPNGLSDLWFDTSDNNKPYRWNGTVWVTLEDPRIPAASSAVQTLDSRVTQTENQLTSQASDITTLNASVNQRNRTWAQPAPPAGSAHLVNDLWIDTDDSNKLYRWDGTAWIITADERFTQRNRVYAQTDAPGGTAHTVNDLWIDTNADNRLYRWDGSAWAAADDARISANASAVSGLTTTVSNLNGQISATAQQVTNLSTTVDGHTASINSQQTSINGLVARYSVSVDANGRMAGWVLNSNGQQGTFDIIADNFRLYDPPSNIPVLEYREASTGLGKSGTLAQFRFEAYTHFGMGVYAHNGLDVTGSLLFRNGSGVAIHTFGDTGATFTGGISATGNVTGYSSDARLKTNRQLIQSPMEKLSQIGGYSYDWNVELCEELGFQFDNAHEHGVLAQEVQKVLPDAVAPAPFNSDYLTVRYDRLVPLLIEAVKDQQRQIEELKQMIRERV